MNKLEAVIFDWAGTLVDFGSRAPMGAFVKAFAAFDVEITLDEARAPMGRGKRDHIAAVFATPRVAAAWQAQHGKAPDDAAIDALYEVFLPLNTETAAHYSTPIPGAAKVLADLRARGLKIGSTTGYTRSIMTRVLPVAAEGGVATDLLFCSDELCAGRPHAAGMFANMLKLEIANAAHVVKVDDTPVGIEEGRNAGAWTVGLTLSGNETGLSEAELDALSAEERSTARDRATARFTAVGAHFVIDTINDLPAVLAEIEDRLAAGQRP
ncbi:phosphonoacetaldehyde hydrolase [Xinfangfangia sp. CPCC 101601]|uniref:Phosphonoacetaldehyde hydrolase n=1 Tax=Pseudogemmobacter lacusdianii TaxID=3069608 RepID=A0ABU0W166_9RHOB|nr:phosphonoacetaldehyde hydrolase [Xinfangfangia sp. CPCC 101601]MDQ2067759.1 phosphonoacetaldehyde hydrolase [Xinfangfangia sp. CPCC 101601]